MTRFYRSVAATALRLSAVLLRLRERGQCYSTQAGRTLATSAGTCAVWTWRGNPATCCPWRTCPLAPKRVISRRRAGIPAVICGPGSISQAHQADEWIAVDQLQQGYRFLAEVARWAQAG